MLRFLFSFKGELDRWRYLALALPAFLIQPAYVYACLAATGQAHRGFTAGFAFNPLRELAGISAAGILFGGLAIALLAGWVIGAASVRRLRDAGVGPQMAAAAIIPVLQLLLIVVLTLLGRERAASGGERPPRDPDQQESDTNFRHMLIGALVGMALCVIITAFSTLVLGNYGAALFLAMPVVVGMCAAYIAAREEEIGYGASVSVALGALFLGAVALIGVAIEGAICLAMAAPLAIPLAMFGAAIGNAWANGRRNARSTLSAVALLPMFFALEAAMPPQNTFVSVVSVDVAASADEVWASITNMGTIDEPPAAPFGWGLAYPIAGEIDGEGVGAIRRGVFSTGVAFEKVTIWEPGRELTFDVLSNPPALKELSPHDQVHAPHLAGYFTTAYAKFTITPLADGRVRLALETEHDLDLEPAIYWAPLAQWAILTNKTRVLKHFADRAEAMTAN